MSTLLLLTSALQPSAEVLPALALLGHSVRILPSEGSALLEAPDSDLLLVDGRQELAHARDLCRLIRTTGTDVPVLLVVTEGGLAVVAHDWAMDDVVLHTCGPAELEARIRLAIGRLAAQREADDPAAHVIRTGEVVVDDATYTAKVSGRALDLTYKEFELLKFLAQHPGRVFTRQQLLQEVWGYDYFGGTRTVDVHVRRLRAKLGPENEHFIGTVRNVGYRFVLPSKDKAAEQLPRRGDLGRLTGNIRRAPGRPIFQRALVHRRRSAVSAPSPPGTIGRVPRCLADLLDAARPASCPGPSSSTCRAPGRARRHDAPPARAGRRPPRRVRRPHRHADLGAARDRGGAVRRAAAALHLGVGARPSRRGRPARSSHVAIDASRRVQPPAGACAIHRVPDLEDKVPLEPLPPRVRPEVAALERAHRAATTWTPSPPWPPWWARGPPRPSELRRRWRPAAGSAPAALLTALVADLAAGTHSRARARVPRPRRPAARPAGAVDAAGSAGREPGVASTATSEYVELGLVVELDSRWHDNDDCPGRRRLGPRPGRPRRRAGHRPAALPPGLRDPVPALRPGSRAVFRARGWAGAPAPLLPGLRRRRHDWNIRRPWGVRCSRLSGRPQPRAYITWVSTSAWVKPSRPYVASAGALSDST